MGDVDAELVERAAVHRILQVASAEDVARRAARHQGADREEHEGEGASHRGLRLANNRRLVNKPRLVSWFRFRAVHPSAPYAP